MAPWMAGLERRFPTPPPEGVDPLTPLKIHLAREIGDWEEVDRLLIEGLAPINAMLPQSSPGQRAQHLENAARLYLEADLPQMALRMADEAITIDPAKRHGYLSRALALRDLGDGRAQVAFQEVHRHRPLDLEAWLSKEGIFPPRRPAPPRPVKKVQRHNIPTVLPDR